MSKQIYIITMVIAYALCDTLCADISYPYENNFNDSYVIEDLQNEQNIAQVAQPKIKVPQSSESYELQHRAQFNSPEKGIYISQPTLEDREYLQYLINRATEVGINTFIIDMNYISNAYEKNILLVKNAGIKYIARVVVFPLGGDRAKLTSESYWMTRYRLMDAAIALGAEQIQLDYIRYAASNAPSPQNKHDVHNVIKWFKERIGDRAELQIDVFGESSYIESPRIGQHIPTFAMTVDAVCPMLYPSHFEPYLEHAKRPYDTIYNALVALKSNYKGNKPPFQLIPYIELSNYRHSFTEDQLVGYIHSQIKAVEDANADGWYAWSAGNKYDRLFNILANDR